jgi:hypothetical protein
MLKQIAFATVILASRRYLPPGAHREGHYAMPEAAKAINRLAAPSACLPRAYAALWFMARSLLAAARLRISSRAARSTRKPMLAAAAYGRFMYFSHAGASAKRAHSYKTGSKTFALSLNFSY